VSNREIVLSAEQRAAILTPGNLLIRAGAGSGKTEVLARRFVALIAGDIEGRPPLLPEQVAAITFTEKAAHDMRARIASVLEQRTSEERPGECRNHLLRARRTISLARISTIHAFCARILRESALEAGLDPDFQVLDEYESQTFRERICKQTLIAAIRRADRGAVYLVSARRLESTTPREDALAIVMRILDELARHGRTPQWLDEATRQSSARIHDEEERVETLARELDHRLDELLGARNLTARAEAAVGRMRARQDEFRRQILAINAQVEPRALDFLRDFCDCLPDARGGLRDCISSIKRIVNGAGSGFGLEGELISAYGACRAMPAALAVAETIHEVAAKFEAAKAAERVLTFDDLLLRVRELLRQSRDTAQRYRATIRVLLVDEYQDTDAIQDEIVALLAKPGAHPEEAPELFVVGDEKQSIYRFRGADVTVFGRIRSRLKLALHELPLVGNRRSTPNIVEFVNRIGAHLMQSEEQPAPPYWVEWGAHHELSALRAAQIDPPVELITAIPDSTSESERKLDAGGKRALEGRAIAGRIHQLAGDELITDSAGDGPRRIEYRDIAILLRAFTDVAIYERELLTAGVPCYTVKGRGFFACPEVLDLIELLTAVSDPADSMALAAALRSPFFGLSDDCLAEIVLHRKGPQGSVEVPPRRALAAEFAAPLPAFEYLTSGRADAVRAWRILDELRRLRRRGTIMEVIEHALESTGYEAVMLGLPQGQQRAANLRKLVELAREFEARRLFTFHDFVIHLRRLVEQEPYEPPAQILGENENVVRLMTIHQAKGLEFPVVILADAGRAPNNDNRVPVVDPETGLLLHDTDGSGMDEIPNCWLEDFRQRSNSEQRAESLRLLYVALTRARDRLIISEGATLRGWAKQIRTLFGCDVLDSFIKSGAESEPLEFARAKAVLRRPEFAESMRHAHGAKPVSALDSQAEADEFTLLARRRLGFELQHSHELVISPTALADFDRCPRQFHFRHGLKMPEPGYGRDATSQQSTSAMGTVAHAVLERLQLKHNSEEEIRRLVDLLGVPAGLDSEQRSTIAADLLRYLAACGNSTPAAREVPFFYHLGESMFVRGQIDAIVNDGDGIIVRDYKYARPADEGRLYQVQMETYALAVAEAYPQSRVEAEIVFLRDPSVTVPVKLPPIAEMRSRISAMARDVAVARASGEYLKKPADVSVCRQFRCAFVARCWGH
jgi:ATP-dependent helicase/nuclease subunit A